MKTWHFHCGRTRQDSSVANTEELTAISHEAAKTISRTTAISALYQAERQDLGSSQLGVLAIGGVALTYLGVVAVIINSTNVFGNAWITPFLPLPLWLIVLFYGTFIGATFLRARSVAIVEDQLFDIIGFPESYRAQIGNQATAKVADMTEAPRVWKIVTTIFYSSVFMLGVLFTIYCLILAAKRNGWISASVISAEVTYLWLYIVIYAAWRQILLHGTGPNHQSYDKYDRLD